MAARKRVCRVRGCGRRVYSQRCCQTHHRRLLAGKPLGPISPYRERSREPTARFAGMTWPKEMAGRLRRRQSELGASEQGTIVAILLQTWARP